MLQVMVDVAILTQVWLYYENTAKRKKTQINMHFWQEDLDYGDSGQDYLENITLIPSDDDELDDDPVSGDYSDSATVSLIN